MKRYMRGIIALLMSAGIATSGAPGSASAEDCSGAIINSGAGSTNTVECVDVSTVHVSCINNINVVTSSTQAAETGGGTGLGNTNGGSVITGNATNENGQVVQIGAACEAQAVTQPTNPAQPTTTQTATTPSVSAPVTAPRVTTLPSTASNSLVDTVIVGGVSLVGLLGISRIGVEVYRQLALKW